MSSDSEESTSEAEQGPNKKARYQEEGDADLEDDEDNSQSQRIVEESDDEESEEGDEDDLDYSAESDLRDHHRKKLKLKERGARTHAILRQPSPTAEGCSDDSEKGDLASEDEPFAEEQVKPSTNGAGQRGENEGE